MTTMREAFVAATSQALDRDPRLAVVLAAISADLFQPARQRHPHRVIDVGIREQLMIGVAGGMAIEGFRPVVHTYAPFLLERPIESLKTDLAHQGVSAVLVSVGASYDEPGYGRTHACPEDVALLDALTGWDVAVPGHPDEAVALLEQAFRSDRPSYIRLSVLANEQPILDAGQRFLALRQGRLGTVVAVGPVLDAVIVAMADLDVTVLYTSQPRPWDHATLRETLAAPSVVIVEPYLAGTSLAQVATSLRDVPHRSLGLGVGEIDLHRYGTPAEHTVAHGLDAASLRRSITDFLRLE